MVTKSEAATPGTVIVASCSLKMNIAIVIEHSIQTSWDYLDRSGELGEPHEAAEFLLNSIVKMVRTGESRGLMLSNKAIDNYRKYRAGKLAA